MSCLPGLGGGSNSVVLIDADFSSLLLKERDVSLIVILAQDLSPPRFSEANWGRDPTHSKERADHTDRASVLQFGGGVWHNDGDNDDDCCVEHDEP